MSREKNQCEGKQSCGGVASHIEALDAWLCISCELHIAEQVKKFNAEWIAAAPTETTE